MENPKYPRYKVVDHDGKPIGIAVCNLELPDLQKRNIMEGGQYPRYKVVDHDGKVVAFAVCNLELEEPQEPPVGKDQASDGKEVELKDWGRVKKSEQKIIGIRTDFRRAGEKEGAV